MNFLLTDLLHYLLFVTLTLALLFLWFSRPSRPFNGDLKTGQAWQSRDDSTVWLIIKIDPVGIVVFDCYFDNDTQCRSSKTRSQFRRMLKSHQARLVVV